LPASNRFRDEDPGLHGRPPGHRFSPLSSGGGTWQSQGVDDERITVLCDIAMQGDRGIASSFGCELKLGETIAKGFDKCEIRFKRSNT